MSESLAELLRRFYAVKRQALYTYALSLTRCPAAAEDAVQNAICGLLRRGRVPKELQPYVFACVRNAALDILRANHRHEAACSLFTPTRHEKEAPSVAQEDAEHLLSILNDDERECVVLKIYAGMTFAEIGAVRGESGNTIATRYRRAIEKMRIFANGELQK